MTIKDNFKEFCKLFNEEPYPWQEAIAEKKQWSKFICCGRGAGKSWVSRKLILWHALKFENSVIVAVASSKSQILKILRERLHTEIDNSKLKVSVTNDLADEIRFSNGSVIYCLPSEASSSRGFQPVQYMKDFKLNFGGFAVYFEEAAFIPEFKEMFTALFYGLLSVPVEKRLLLIATTPSGMNHASYELFQRGIEENPDYISITVPSYENPNWHGNLEKLKQELSEVEYQTEIMAQWMKSINSYFVDILDSSIGIYETGQPEDGWSYYCGFDGSLGISSRGDYIVIALVGRKDNLFKIVELGRWKKADQSEIEQYVLNLHNKYQFRKIAVETFQGKALNEFCQKNGIDSEMIHATSSYQQEHFSNFHSIMAQHRLMISPVFSVLLEEMGSFQQRISPTGNISFGAATRAHDDTVFAVMHALKEAIADNSEGISAWLKSAEHTPDIDGDLALKYSRGLSGPASTPCEDFIKMDEYGEVNEDGKYDNL
jgi:hypothetical protein